MMIPDPVELMEAQQERLAHEWDDAQKGVPDGSFRCPYCGQVREGQPIAVDSGPASAECCFECLPDDAKAAFEAFEASMNDAKADTPPDATE